MLIVSHSVIYLVLLGTGFFDLTFHSALRIPQSTLFFQDLDDLELGEKPLPFRLLQDAS